MVNEKFSNTDLKNIWLALGGNTPSFAMTEAEFIAAFNDITAITPLNIKNTADRLEDADGVSAGNQLRAIFRNTKDWDNSGYTVAQLLLQLVGILTGVYGNTGVAHNYELEGDTFVNCSTFITDKISFVKGNFARCIVNASGVVFNGTDWNAYVNITY